MSDDENEGRLLLEGEAPAIPEQKYECKCKPHPMVTYM